MQFVSVLLGNLIIFSGPELLKISKTIDLSCKSIEYAWAQAVSQSGVHQSRFVGLRRRGCGGGGGGDEAKQRLGSKVLLCAGFGDFCETGLLSAPFVAPGAETS